MCEPIEEVAGTVDQLDGETLVIRFDAPVRVQTCAIMRTIYHSYLAARDHPELSAGDRVLCQVRLASEHAGDPVQEVSRSGSFDDGNG